MAQTKLQATATLFLDTKNAQSDAKQFVNDIKQKLAEVETAADKMSVFKDLVGYIAQIDRALTALKAKNTDAFNSIFGNLDAGLKGQLESIFGIDGAKLGKLDVLREKLNNLTPKSSIDEIRNFAKTMNDVFESMGLNIPFPDVKEAFAEFSKEAKAGHIETLKTKLSEFATVWENVTVKMSGGFGVGGGGASGGGKFSKEVQDEIDRLEEQANRYNTIINKFKEVSKMKLDWEDGKKIKLDVEETEAAAQNLIAKFNELDNAINNGSLNRDGHEYADALVERAKAALQLIELQERLTKWNKDGDLVREAPKFLRDFLNVNADGESVTEYALEDFGYEASGIIKKLQQEAKNATNQITELKGSFSDMSAYSGRESSIDDAVEDIGDAAKLSKKQVDALSDSLKTALLSASQLAVDVSNGKAVGKEHMNLFDASGLISTTSGLDYQIDTSTLVNQLVANLKQNIVMSLHNHPDNMDVFSVSDVKSFTDLFYGQGTKIHGIIADGLIKTIDFNGVTQEVAKKIAIAYSENLRKMSEQYSNLFTFEDDSIKLSDRMKEVQVKRPEQFTELMSMINSSIDGALIDAFKQNGVESTLKVFDASTLQDLANYLTNIQQSGQSAIAPVEKLKNLIISLSPGRDIDFSKYADIFSQLESGAIDGTQALNKILSIDSFSTVTTGATEAANAVDQAKAKVDEFLNLSKEIQNTSFYNFGDARDNIPIGQYTEQLEVAKREFEELRQQGLLTEEQIRSVSSALAESETHLKDSTRYYDNYGSSYDYSYYDEYRAEQRRADELQSELDRNEEQKAADTTAKIERSKAAMEEFIALKNNIMNLQAGDNTSDWDIGLYTERLINAKSELEQFGAQGLITAEQMKQLDDAYEAASSHLVSQTKFYTGYGSEIDNINNSLVGEDTRSRYEIEREEIERTILALEEFKKAKLSVSDSGHIMSEDGMFYYFDAILSSIREFGDKYGVETTDIFNRTQQLISEISQAANATSKTETTTNAPLEEKLSLVRQIAQAYVDLADAQSVGTDREEELAQGKLSAFESQYHSIIATMQDGSKVNITLDDEFADATARILENANQIQNIQLVPRSAEDAVKAYDALDRVFENLNQRWTEPNTLERAVNSFDLKAIDDYRRHLETSINAIKTGDPNFQFGSSEKLDQAIVRLEKLDELSKRIGLQNKFSEMFPTNFEWTDNLETSYLKVLDGIKNGTYKTVEECMARFRELTNTVETTASASTSTGTQVAAGTVQQGASSGEIASLEMLRQKLFEVRDAVDAKTKAFEEEYVTVDAAVKAEITSLQELINKILEVSTQVGQVENGLKNIGASSIQLNVGNSEEQLASLLTSTNLIGEIGQLEKLQGVILNVKNAIASKTKAFIDEGNTVGQTVGKEIAALKSLADMVDSIAPKVNALVQNIKNIDAAKLVDSYNAQNAPPEDPFKARLSAQKGVFTKYINEVKDADYLTEDLKKEIDFLSTSLNEVSNQSGLDQWIKGFSNLKDNVKVAKSEFEQINLGGINLFKKELSSSFNKLSFSQKEGMLQEYLKTIVVLNQLEQEVKEGHAVELSGIQQITAALQEKINKQLEANRAAKDATNVQKKNGNFGSTASINATSKYNSLSKTAASDQFANSSEVSAIMAQYTQAYNRVIALRDQFRGQDVISEEEKAEFKQATTDCNNYAMALDKIFKSTMKLKGNKANTDDYMLGSDFNYANIEQRKAALADFVQQTYGVEVAAENFRNSWNEVVFAVDNGDGTFTQMTATFTDARNEIVALNRDVKKTPSAFGSFINSLKGSFHNVARYLTTFGSVYRIISMIRQGLTQVVEIDSALTELKKVTNETSASYNQFLQDMSKTGAVVGATIKDLTQSAADWARLGYSMQEAGELAKNTSILMNVSEFTDVSQATDTLISALQAFKKEGQDVATFSMEIIDKYNEVGNNYAISTSDLANSLTRSSAALVAANNSLEESIALTTAANTTIQDPDSVGNALKVVSMRIRGVKTELEEAGEDTEGMVENTAKLQEKIMALTNIDGKGGINILTESGDFKSTYEILLGISKVWEEMDDVSQAALLEVIAGKTRGSVVASLFQNGDILEEAYNSAIGASGSAMNELNTYLDSIQGRIDIFKNAVQTMWMNFVDSEAAKDIVDLGTSVIRLVDAIGLIPTALGAFVAFKASVSGIKTGLEAANKTIAETIVAKKAQANASKVVANAQAQENTQEIAGTAAKKAGTAASWKDVVATNAQTAATKALAVAKGLLKGIGYGIITMALATIGSKAIEGISKAFDKVINRAENLKKEVEELKTTYEEAKKTFNDNLETLTTSSDTKLYSTLQDEFAALAAGVDKYGNNISLTSDEYERYKEICEEIVGVNPQIVAGYDDATRAIGNNVSILERLIELQREQQRNSVKEYINNENLSTMTEKAVNDYNEMLGKIHPGSLGLSGVKILEDGTEQYGFIHQIDKYIARAIGIAKDESESLSEYIENNYEIIKEKIPEILDIADDDFVDDYGQKWRALNEMQIDLLYEFLDDSTSNIEEYKDGLIDTLLQVPLSSRDYDELTQSSRGFVTEWIKNAGQFKIDKDTTPEDVQQYRDIILELINDISDEDFEIEYKGDTFTAQELIDQIYNLDPSTVNWATYQNELYALMDAFWNAIGGDDNKYGITRDDLIVAFDLEFVQEEDESGGKYEQTREQVGEMVGKTAKEIQAWLDKLPAEKVIRFYEIDWNKVDNGKVNDFGDVESVIDGFVASEPAKEKLAKTYSALSSSAEEFNSIQQQTDEILHSGIEVTQEYKDALLELGISEEELKECFDETNPLMVKNASALKELVEESKYNAAQNVKLAKSHARLKYANLVKELNKVLDVTGELPATNRAAAESILSQIDAVETAIYKYTLLEDKLLGVHNAFEKFNEAKETDGLNTYGDSYVEMVQTMYDAHTKTGEYGTEAYQAAVDALINPNHELLQGVEKGTAAYHQAVRDILMNEIVPTLTLDGDSLSIDQASMMEFVRKNLGEGKLFSGTMEDFNLTEGMDLERAVELTGMTKTQIYAMLAALKDFVGVDFLSMFDNSTEGQIVNTTQKLEELNRQKLELLKSGVSADSDEIKTLNEEIQKLLGNLDALKEKAHGEVTEYETISGLMSQLDGLGDLSEVTQDKLQNAFTDDQKNMLVEMGIDLNADDAQTVMDKLTQQLLLLGGEPTVVTVQYAIEANEDRIAELEGVISNLNSMGATQIRFEGELWRMDELQAEIDRLKKQNEDWGIRFNITEETTVLEEMQEIEEFVIHGKYFSVGFANNSYLTTSRQLVNLANLIKTIKDTSFEVGATITWNGDGAVDGTAHVLGTAFKTGSWGAPKTERALVGELGPELLVRGSKWTTIGENGAEFTNIRKGDIIFNHKQTEDLLSKGYISGRGRSIGSAFASGTAYNNPTGGFLPVMNNKGSSTDGSSSGKDDEFEEVFDWFEVLLEEINEQLDLMNAKLENAVGISAKGSLIDQLLNAEHYKMYELAEGIKLYTDYAAELLQEIPEEYREMAQNGEVEITEFLGEANEETVTAINNYRDWAQKVADLNLQLEETKTEIAELAKQKFDIVTDEYDNILGVIEAQRDQFDAMISLMEDRGYVAATEYYESMIQNTIKQSEELEKQKSAMQAVLDEQVELGNIQVGSEQWYEMVMAIYDVDAAITDCTADLEEYQNAINDIYWDNFENLTNRLDYLKEETQSLIDLMDNEDMVITPETDDGWSADQVQWSEEGMASLGLYAQQMEIAEYTARQYAEAIDDLNADFAAGKYSESEYQEKLAELTSAQYDSIEAYYDAQDAIKDLQKTRVDAIKEGIEKEIEAYEKLIQKKKEELDADKDLYDFEKSIADQQKNISDIERKIAALSADNSMAAIAKRKQLEAELAEAQANLEESYHDRSVTDQQTALDKELENFKEEKDAEIEELEKYLEDVETLIADSLTIIQDNASGIYDTLSDKANEYNLTLSDSIVTPWQDGELAVSDYQETFDTAISSTMDQLDALKNKWQEVIDTMAEAAQTEINSQQQENDRIVEASPVQDLAGSLDEKPIVVGGKINAGSALIYADSNGSGASTQYYSSDPIYTVLEEKNGYVLVRHRSLSSGSTGWFKKSDVRGYAKGTTGTQSDELAWIDELGEELVMHADGSGKLSFLTKGTAVIPHDISENLMELGQLDPSDVLSRNTPAVSMSPSVTTNNTEISMQIAEVVHIDTVSNETIPDLTKAIEKQMDKYMKNINNNIRKYTR